MLAKAVRQDPTVQVLAQLALDVLRQGTLVLLPGLCEKRLKVLGDGLVTKALEAQTVFARNPSSRAVPASRACRSASSVEIPRMLTR